MKKINTFNRTVKSLCEEIDYLKEEIMCLEELYESEKMKNISMTNENLKRAQIDVANTLRFALCVKDNENGDLVISKEDRKNLSKNFITHKDMKIKK